VAGLREKEVSKLDLTCTGGRYPSWEPMHHHNFRMHDQFVPYSRVVKSP
jgi:hypothetical protein